MGLGDDMRLGIWGQKEWRLSLLQLGAPCHWSSESKIYEKGLTLIGKVFQLFGIFKKRQPWGPIDDVMASQTKARIKTPPPPKEREVTSNVKKKFYQGY